MIADLPDLIAKRAAPSLMPSWTPAPAAPPP